MFSWLCTCLVLSPEVEDTRWYLCHDSLIFPDTNFYLFPHKPYVHCWHQLPWEWSRDPCLLAAFPNLSSFLDFICRIRDLAVFTRYDAANSELPELSTQLIRPCDLLIKASWIKRLRTSDWKEGKKQREWTTNVIRDVPEQYQDPAQLLNDSVEWMWEGMMVISANWLKWWVGIVMKTVKTKHWQKWKSKSVFPLGFILSEQFDPFHKITYNFKPQKD